LFFFQAEDGIRDATVTGVQTCALPISMPGNSEPPQTRIRSGMRRESASHWTPTRATGTVWVWAEEQPAAAMLTRIIIPAQKEIKDRKSTRLNSSHGSISYAVFCLKKKQ